MREPKQASERCATCGLALEGSQPARPAPGRARLGACVVLLVGVPVLRLVARLAGFAALGASPAVVWLEWGCDALIVLSFGARLFARDARALHRSLYLFSLLGLGLGALYAGRAAFLPSIPPALIAMHFELAASITLLLLLAERLEGRLHELVLREPARERVVRIAPIQRLTLAACTWLDIGAAVVAVAAFVAWLAVGPAPRLGAALLAAGATLLVQRSCTLRHGVWLAMRLATSRPSREGVLVHDPAVLEAIGEMRTLLIDEHVLTEGRPRVVVVEASRAFAKRELAVLAAAASLEGALDVRLGPALVASAREHRQLVSPAVELHALAGGAIATVNGRRVAVGAESTLATLGIATSELATQAHQLRDSQAHVLFVAIDGALAAVVGIHDPLRAGMVAAIGHLQRDGVRIALAGVTDSGPCNALQRDLNLCEYPPASSGAAPGSIRLVDAEPEAGTAVGFARETPPAGAEGTAAASVTLAGQLTLLARARAIGRETLRIIRQNLALSGTLDALALLLAAGTLHALIGWTLGPLLAAALLSASAAMVLGNVLRLARAP